VPNLIKDDKATTAWRRRLFSRGR